MTDQLRSHCLSLRRVAGEQPERLALIDGDVQVSYAELLSGAQAAQGWLFSQGLLEQPLLAIVAEASRRSIELVLAAIDLGLPIGFVHPRLHPAERQRLLASFQCTRAAILLDDSALPPSAGAAAWREAATGNAAPGKRAPSTQEILEARAASLTAATGASLAPDELWRCWEAVLFTSGSTGAPKAVSLGSGQILAAVRASERNLGWLDQDRWLLSLPVAHVGGLSILLRCLAAAATVVLPAPGSGLDLGRLTSAAERHAVSLMSVVPTQLELISGWRPPASLRAALVGGAAARPATLAQARRDGFPTLTTYGATEACSQIATQALGSPLREDGAVGGAVADTEIRIVDGRIRVRGPQLMRGYLAPSTQLASSASREPASHASASREASLLRLAEPSGVTDDGWLVTSDLGELTADGWLRVLGRLDDVIITGGENVHPAEVEQVLLEHPSVTACVVAGVEDPKFGQLVGALLEGPEPGADQRARQILEFCAQRLAPHKRPRVLAWAEHLPQLPSGKLDRTSAQRALNAFARNTTRTRTR